MNSLSIGQREIGPGHPCFIVAEIAQAHDGSLGRAHAFIDAASAAGVDAIKFQTHIAAAESTPQEPFRVHFSRQDETRYAYWRRMEFTPEQWRGLRDHAREAGLVFLSTPFSLAAIELLIELDVPAWKVGSGDLGTLPFIKRMARTRRPVLLSSGLATWADLDAAVAEVRAAGAPLAIYQCTTAYPCPPEQIGLNVLAELRARYGCPVGLSDHSGTIFPGLAAVALGANLLEAHVCFSKTDFGPDTPASLTVEEWGELVHGVRHIEAALRHPINKDDAARALGDLRTMFGRGLAATRALPAGHELAEGDLACKKPARGLPAIRLDDVLGRTLARPLAADQFIEEADLAPPP